MKKKTICGILSAALLFGLLPMTALAADDLTTVEKSLDFRNQENDVTNSELGYSWDADRQKLTLTDFRVTVPYDKLEEKALIYLPEESRIEVNGENILDVNAFRCHAIYCEGDLNIDGDGVLEIKTGSYNACAIYLINGPLLIDEEVEIKVDPEGHVIFVDEAKGSRPIISIQEEAKLSFPEEKAEDDSILITHTNKVTPKDNWLDFSEEYDDWDETIVLVAKKADTSQDTKDTSEDTKDTPLDTETPPMEPQLNEYQITIGSPAIVKNGEVSYTADVSPYLKGGYTMLPLRALLEVSDPEQEVKWDNAQKMAYTFVNNRYITVRPGEPSYTKAAQTIPLRTPAETVNGRLFVSLRDWMDIMEIPETQLSWNPETKTVTLTY